MIFLVIIFIVYLLLLLLLVVILRSYSRSDLGAPLNTEISISIIVPFRNEEKRLTPLLKSMVQLEGVNEHVEVLFVDDSSTDNSIELIKNFVEREGLSRCHILSSEDASIKGKKNALHRGILKAKGEVVMTTDADCVLPQKILGKIRSEFLKPGRQMVLGPVFLKGDTFFSSLQSIEQMVLVGVGAATLKLGIPTMCNGANLAFRKTAYEKVSGYSGNEHIPSGDDEFLMHKVFRAFGKSAIGYRFGKNATVLTVPVKSVKEAVFQRKRWGSKWKHYELKRTKLFSMFIFLFHLSYIVYMTALSLGYDWRLFVGLCLMRILLELVLLSRSSFLIGGRVRILPFMMMAVGYSFYAVILGLLGTLGSYNWKDRSYK